VCTDSNSSRAKGVLTVNAAQENCSWFPCASRSVVSGLSVTAVSERTTCRIFHFCTLASTDAPCGRSPEWI
jgi:hypothetical protein